MNRILGTLLFSLMALALIAGIPAVSRAADPNTVTTSNQINTPESPDGYQIGNATTSKVAFHGTTPVAQRSDASQAAITCNTTGTVSDTFTAPVGITTLALPIALSATSGSGDIVTNYTLGYKFKILSLAFVVTKPVTTGSKAMTVNMEIGSTDLTGGVIALTSSNCTPLGAQVVCTAVTAANTGSATASISVEASAVTAFSEGEGVLLVKIQNMDTADFATTVADKWNELRSVLVGKGLMLGS